MSPAPVAVPVVEPVMLSPGTIPLTRLASALFELGSISAKLTWAVVGKAHARNAKRLVEKRKYIRHLERVGRPRMERVDS
ncbi:MAG: hypothetical protein SGI72_03255 [Planctomycetota bacterium]|nr:hypothetical protein [Planctomycetota bacterium]